MLTLGDLPPSLMRRQTPVALKEKIPFVCWRRTPSRPGESHPQPLTDPYVSLSTHTARVIQRRPTTSFIQIEGFFPLPVDRNESIMNRMTRPLRSTGVTQLHRYYEAVCPWCEHRYFRSHGLSTCTFSLAISRPGSHVSHWSPYQGHAAYTPAAV